ncbi:MAG: 1-(5-phosphoribosyl)-5-[(5-phosphoribosylamino)methylideneamino]imidazole-4-carboxamide isomerase [Capsulimonadaceae bacterium]|nr:1-(5-phosphoribosyl)-5-[(5-phosphoribosylamino)methylideneamino]imidazole-4-carboxamide isomerase [Capsulimonadaceae bacterium]
MEIIPAIDLKCGKCVRLTQGRFEHEKQYSDDPLRVARRWLDEGATRLHVVDLDGAREGKPSEENIAIVRDIVRQIGIPVQIGGGIRSRDTAQRTLEAGIDRIIIGTAAVSDPSIAELFAEFGERIVLGIDATQGKVAVQGWQQATHIRATDFAREMVAKGVRRIIFTDISRDGMLTGPNIPALNDMIDAAGIPVIASGGVGTLKDIRDLAATRAEGVIVGKALYEGTINLTDAIATAAAHGA